MVEVVLMFGAAMVVFICVAGALTAFIIRKKRLRKRLRGMMIIGGNRTNL